MVLTGMAGMRKEVQGWDTVWSGWAQRKEVPWAAAWRPAAQDTPWLVSSACPWALGRQWKHRAPQSGPASRSGAQRRAVCGRPIPGAGSRSLPASGQGQTRLAAWLLSAWVVVSSFGVPTFAGPSAAWSTSWPRSLACVTVSGHPGVRDHVPPACAGKTAGSSTRPLSCLSRRSSALVNFFLLLASLQISTLGSSTWKFCQPLHPNQVLPGGPVPSRLVLSPA